MTSDLDTAKIIGNPDLEIEQVEYDSRQVRPGTLFVAIKGFIRDGWDFVPDAVDRGAAAVMGERKDCDLTVNYVQVDDARMALSTVAARFYGFPGRKLKICGVTGTNGKTTTCYLTRKILEARGKKVGLITSSVYDTGGEVHSAERTTPESLDVQRLLAQMKHHRCVNAVVEVSSHALVLNRVDNVPFRVAVFTNLTRDHLDFHGTMEEYLEAKKILLRKLEGHMSYAVINIDVPEFRNLIGEYGTSYIGYSLQDSSADVYCSDYTFTPTATRFDLVTPMGKRSVTFPLPGKFNLMNAIAAASAGLACGVDVDNVIRGLEQAEPVPGRFEGIDRGQPFGVYIDFAHTPDALARLCESAREITRGQLLILFGCGGDRDSGKRPLMGEAASTGADYCVVTSDNPRSEDPLAIIDEVKPGLVGDKYQIIPDRQEAIKSILGMAHEDDVVLLAGKGAENYQEVNGVREPFSDSEEAEQVLAALGFCQTTVDEGN